MKRLALVISVLAFASASASRAAAQAPYPGAVPYSTYVFQGCLQNVSCHTATVSLFHADHGNAAITIDVFSYYLRPSAGISFYNIFPLTRDADLTGVATFCTLGQRNESAWTYAAASYIPQYLDLAIDTCNEPEEFGTAHLSLVNSFTTTPEPGTLALLGVPVVGLVGWSRRRGGRASA